MPHHTPDEIQLCAICNKEFKRGNVNGFIGGRCNECSDKLREEWRQSQGGSVRTRSEVAADNKEHDAICLKGCGYCRTRRGIKKYEKR